MTPLLEPELNPELLSRDTRDKMLAKFDRINKKIDNFRDLALMYFYLETLEAYGMSIEYEVEDMQTKFNLHGLIRKLR